MSMLLPVNYDVKATLYKKGLNGQLVNYLQNYLYPSRIGWKNVFQTTLAKFNDPKDTVLLYETGVIPNGIDYEWVDRLPPLMSCETGEILYRSNEYMGVD
jgi:hypothetical protein